MQGTSKKVFDLIVSTFNTLNHSANFFLYVLSGKQFRQWFREVITCNKHVRRQGLPSTRPSTPTTGNSNREPGPNINTVS